MKLTLLALCVGAIALASALPNADEIVPETEEVQGSDYCSQKGATAYKENGRCKCNVKDKQKNSECECAKNGDWVFQSDCCPRPPSPTPPPPPSCMCAVHMSHATNNLPINTEVISTASGKTFDWKGKKFETIECQHCKKAKLYDDDTAQTGWGKTVDNEDICSGSKCCNGKTQYFSAKTSAHDLHDDLEKIELGGRC